MMSVSDFRWHRLTHSTQQPTEMFVTGSEELAEPTTCHCNIMLRLISRTLNQHLNRLATTCVTLRSAVKIIICFHNSNFYFYSNALSVIYRCFYNLLAFGPMKNTHSQLQSHIITNTTCWSMYENSLYVYYRECVSVAIFLLKSMSLKTYKSY